MLEKKETCDMVGSRPTELATPLLSFMHGRMLSQAAKIIGDLKPLKILEVGVGYGYLARAARARGYDYLGVDMSKTLVDDLKKEGFKVICGVVPPFPEGVEVDVIWLAHVLEHCSTYLEARELIEQAYQALNPGGYIIIISPDLLSWKMEFWDSHWTHGFPTTIRRCTQLLSDSGFNVIFAGHHTCTVFQPVAQFILDCLTRLIPARFLDFVIKPFARRDFCHSFMTILGWRQIYLVGKKNVEGGK
jgi:SAM-dependent methyltransferase